MSGHGVVVTGYGAVTPFGLGVDRLFENLVAGRNAVQDMGPAWNGAVDGTYSRLASLLDEELPERRITRRQRRFMGRGGIMTCLAADEALYRARLDRGILAECRVGIFVGTTLTGVSSVAQFFRAFQETRSVRQVPATGFFRVMDHSYAANLASFLGCTAFVLGTPGACAAGSLAIGLAYERIRSGLLDVAFCGGSEECTPATSAIFDLLGAAAGIEGNDPSRFPAPFDRSRDGTVPGEGAGILVLEREDQAAARGARILARVLGFASLADGRDMAQPPAGVMERCMRAALADAGLEIDSVDLINAHATGTRTGDREEARAIAAVAGDRVAVNALKGYLGHTLGASGAIESIAVIEMMRRGIVLPTAKLLHLDPECAGIRLQRRREEVSLRVVVKNSFGFGGINSVLILGRGNDD